MTEIQRGDPVEEDVLVDLLQRAQQDADPDAFDGIYLLYVDRVYRYLLARLGDVHSAEEVTSQVFMRLIEKIDMYRISPKDNTAIFSAWLYRMAYNKMVDVMRRQKRRNTVTLEHAAQVSAGNPTDDVYTRMDFEEVMDKLQYLNDQQREVLVLRFIEEQSIEETVLIMRKSQGAVKALQHRALASLRRYLES